METNSADSKPKTMPSKYKFSFFVLFFFMGMINHLGTILILTGSQALAKSFHKNNLMGLYTT